ASFTTCEPGNDGWQIRAKDLQIYREKGMGIARDATVELEGIPFFYTPYLSFPLQRERKSGFLAPHYGSSSTSGFELSVPYFWNLAPNYDLTLTPRVMSKRGLQLRSEFRYLQPQYEGKVFYEVLPDDRVADRTRQLFALKHTHNLWNNWIGTVDYSRVSDSRYFTDLSTKVTLTSQTYLSQQGSLSRGGTWGENGTYTLTGLVQNWQTLQTDPLAPLTPPYSRRPQLSFAAQNSILRRGDFDFQSSYVDFDHPTLVRGKRLMAYPSVSWPLQSAAAYLTPKLGVHMTRYYIDHNTSTLSNASRVLPIATLTSGLTFERNTNIFGNAYTQTLEPKAYYVYIPYKDQNRIPNFESGLQDINFATIFSENQFSGHDRINDANQLTLGASSRLIDPKTGIEVLRVGLAQRYYFRPQEVTLPGVPPRSNQSSRSDLLAVLSGRVATNVTADVGWQFNTDTSQTQRSNISVRYQPQQGKLLNLAYRQNVPSAIRQFDVSGQWPIAGNWSAVGRWNYSTQDRRVLEGLGGLEYDGGCYFFRVVAHRVSTATNTSNTAIFVELELNGLTRVGSNSLDLLRRNVGGYTRGDPHSAQPNQYFVPERN
ncbi:MAG TPA: LPS-assembly protein LptD, partial [Burkholderiales bacterium]|nr:LPS-assembly protein LptD [Burkholderiales bacterium]